eukprot:m.96159 g.96159  ORF g.96159 m.96159 type:complete len:597 (+) comp8963_c0_seq3:70-1860(+)
MDAGYALANAKMSRLAAAARQSIKHNKKKKRKGKLADGEKSSAWDLDDLISAMPRSGRSGDDPLTRAGDWEFPPEKLKNLTELGAGNFGKVYVGLAEGILKGQEKTTVAIKTLTSKGNKAKKEFLQEAGIMQQLDGPHNIVRLLGVCTTKAPNYMIMEFMSRGDLKEVLRHSRPKGDQPSPLTTRRLVNLATDVAEGMAFLASMKIVHRDLAARNCLVAEDYTVKVGDFGLTRDVHTNDYYRMTGSGALPIRWMAPESLMDGVFTSMSDVWAFGIVLWEIVTFGKIPYPLMPNEDVMDQVCDDNYTMPKPKDCPDDLFEIMSNCWEFEPNERPSFITLFKTLHSMDVADSPYLRGDAPASTKEIASSLYSVPQDSVKIYEEADSADEDDDYTPYDIAEEDLATYSMCDVHHPIDEDSYALVDKSRHHGKVAAKKVGAVSTVVTVTEDDDDDDDDDDEDPDMIPMADGKIKSQPSVRRKKGNASAADQKADVIAWIERVVGAKMEGSFHEWLKSGSILCRIMNTIKKNSVPRMHLNTKRAFKMMENISWFLEACGAYGVRSSDLFVTKDLFEEDNIDSVVRCLAALKLVAEKNGFKR